MRYLKSSLLLTFSLATAALFGQNATQYWQQEVGYDMTIDMDVSTNQYAGTQKLTYTNNSPDTLHKVFYHLYFNAFQPGSMMDVRSRTIADPDPRVGFRIADLTPDEIGYQKINSLTQDGMPVKFEVSGTILEVELPQAIGPGAQVIFEMTFNAQVPLQVRRTGRDNKEGVRYSMTQWYPKMAEYDFEGWHANPYIGREFHGVWGHFDVTINIDKDYTVAGSGVVKNPNEVGHGYSDVNPKITDGKISWHLFAKNVHDFAWAADNEYLHKTLFTKNNVELRFFYKNDSSIIENWEKFQPLAVKAFDIIQEKFGTYPYAQYSIIQGGDGGMEYPNATLITGKRRVGSLVGVTVHEALHSWYQGMMATNESKYAWMDEGFTSYASELVMAELYEKYTPFTGSYTSYFNLVNAGKQEVPTMHADHFETNRAYGTTAYSIGCIFLHQLGYVVGEEIIATSLIEYYNFWRFKHPTPNDFLRIVEKNSGLELDWYLANWIGSTNTIDYGLKTILDKGKTTRVTLEKIGKMPMPLDVVVTTKKGDVYRYLIPLRMMRGLKSEKIEGVTDRTAEDWPWVYPYYDLDINIKLKDIATIEIDPSNRMADIDKTNNVYPAIKNVTVTR
jgi:hypothetical protein